MPISKLALMSTFAIVFMIMVHHGYVKGDVLPSKSFAILKRRGESLYIC